MCLSVISQIEPVHAADQNSDDPAPVNEKTIVEVLPSRRDITLGNCTIHPYVWSGGDGYSIIVAHISGPKIKIDLSLDQKISLQPRSYEFIHKGYDDDYQSQRWTPSLGDRLFDTTHRQIVKSFLVFGENFDLKNIKWTNKKKAYGFTRRIESLSCVDSHE
jgi:hypothetical protein